MNSNNDDSQPIFIIGAARSGTSIITTALKKGARIEGFHEGHFLTLLYVILNDIDRFYKSRHQVVDDKRHMIANINRIEFEEIIISNIRKAAESLHQEKIWIDKSPDPRMIKCVPYLKRAWPNAKFIFAKRRGIENLASRMKKFPHVSFDRHCLIWKDCMESWLQVKDLVKDCSIEIEQREIALNPQEISTKLGEFLSLEQNKIDRITKIFSTERPQNTGGKELEQSISLSETGWTNAEIESFKKHCSDINRKYGYSESASYYL